MTKDESLQMTIEELDLAVRCYNCLKRSGINTIGDMCRMTLFDFRHIKNLGRHGIESIIHNLHHHGIHVDYDIWCNCTVCEREKCKLTVNDCILIMEQKINRCQKMRCPVCEKEIDATKKQCSNCGFSDIRNEFLNKEEYDSWMNNTVMPCKKMYGYHCTDRQYTIHFNDCSFSGTLTQIGEFIAALINNK